mgnify:CR=1 FL=1
MGWARSAHPHILLIRVLALLGYILNDGIKHRLGADDGEEANAQQ